MKSSKAAQGNRSERQETRRETRSETRDETQKLEVRYGEIGISAVAAAVQCRGNAKSPAAPGEQSKRKAREWELA